MTGNIYLASRCIPHTAYKARNLGLRLFLLRILGALSDFDTKEENEILNIPFKKNSQLKSSKVVTMIIDRIF